ncbi:unnamed protein product [Parnassius mnemosyne]|uniref:DUF5641 domain-containing protein n=1 Tax=Parnassius mnemosyne TaxID=213953 RepID=A0AAV1KFW4_9NEOP
MRPTVKHVAAGCMICRIRKAKPEMPVMGDLPPARVAHHQRAFTHCGVDLFGPMEVVVGRRREKRWVTEYLPELIPRRKWNEEREPLKVGDLVLVADPGAPRNVWQRAIVEQVFPGKDGRVRLVEIRTKSGTLRRSAARVARIPLSE